MQSEDEFLSELKEHVECPVCYNVYVEPRQLPYCQHTLCRDCCERLFDVQASTLTCPVCRDVSDVAGMKEDFKMKNLAELYNKQTNKIKKTEVQDKGPKEYCDLCEAMKPDIFCNSCKRYLCEVCSKSHTEIFKCQPQVCEEIHCKVMKLTEAVRGKAAEIAIEKGKLSAKTEVDIDEINRSSGSCIEVLQACEDRDLNIVETYYKEQKHSVTNWRLAMIENTLDRNRHLEELCDQTNRRICEDLTETDQFDDKAAQLHVSTLLDMNKEADSLLAIMTRSKKSSRRPAVSNADASVFDFRHAPKVTGENMDVFSRYKEWHSSRAIPLPKQVRDVFVVGGNLMALLEDQLAPCRAKLVQLGVEFDHVLLIDQTGDLGDAWRACIPHKTRDTVVVVSNETGLIKVYLDQNNYEQPQIGLRKIGDLSSIYYDCCAGFDDRMLFAIKCGSKGKPCVAIDEFRNISVINTVETEVGKYCGRLTCGLGLRQSRTLFICNGYCLYEISLSDGSVRGTFGCEGKVNPGEMNSACIATQVDKNIIIADQGNNRLQVFNTEYHSWTIVKTTSHVHQPEAAAWHGGQLYVSGKNSETGGHILYIFDE